MVFNTCRAGIAQKCFAWFVLIVVKYTQHKIYRFNHFKVSNSVAFSIFTMLCSHHLYSVPELFHHPKQTPCTQLLSPPSAPGNHLLSVSMD